jgi:putative hydrolase of HD superfamily
MLDSLLTANNLKSIPRAGWVMRGVSEPESVAEHSYGVVLIALALANMSDELLDQRKVLTMAVLHDLAECLVGDMPVPAQRFFAPGAKHAAEEAAAADLILTLPGGASLLALWREYEARASREALLVRDADRLDTLLQAYVYERRTGNRELAEFWAGPLVQAPFALPASRQLCAELLERRNTKGD